MTIQGIGLFNALGAKMDYLNQRQGVISQNIANSDTPGYRPQDLTETDFSQFLGKSESNSVKPVRLAVTDEKHQHLGNGELDADARKQKKTYEVAPAGNAVVLEEQMYNSGKNMMDYNLMLNVYQKQVGMFRIALGTR